MSKTFYFRYRASEGPVRALLNGFVVINDLAGTGSTTKADPFLRPGENTLFIDARLAPQADVGVQVMMASDDDPADEKVVATLAYAAATHPDGMAEVRFDLPASSQAWPSIATLRPAPDSPQDAYALVSRLADALKEGPDAILLDLLSTKHREIGVALGIGADRMDRGLTAGLQARRSVADFAVELVPFDNFFLYADGDRRLFRALRESGEDAILITVDGMTDGFAVTLGYNGQHWFIIR